MDFLSGHIQGEGDKSRLASSARLHVAPGFPSHCDLWDLVAILLQLFSLGRPAFSIIFGVPCRSAQRSDTCQMDACLLALSAREGLQRGPVTYRPRPVGLGMLILSPSNALCSALLCSALLGSALLLILAHRPALCGARAAAYTPTRSASLGPLSRGSCQISYNFQPTL